MTHSERQAAGAAAQQPTRQQQGQPGAISVQVDGLSTSQQTLSNSGWQPVQQQQQLAWWQPLRLLQPLNACWEVVYEEVYGAVLLVLALVLRAPLWIMSVLIDAAIEKHREQHKEKPLSACFILMVLLLPFGFLPLWWLGELVFTIVALVLCCFSMVLPLGQALLQACQRLHARWMAADISHGHD